MQLVQLELVALSIVVDVVVPRELDVYDHSTTKVD